MRSVCTIRFKMNLLLYVDDLILAGNNSKELSRIQGLLDSEFEMSKVGSLDDKTFIGLNIVRNCHQKTMTISQESYIRRLLKSFDMLNCKEIDSPMEHHLNLKKADNVVHVPYCRLIGSLMFLMRCTRPDICFLVS